MTLPAAVATAWSTFANAVDVTALHEADYTHLAQFAMALNAAGLPMTAAEEQILEVGGREGAPEFLAGELMAGVDVGVRAVAAYKATAAASAGAPAVDAAAAKAAEAAKAKAAEAAKAAESKAAALSKLSPEEKKALGLA
jgi:colicin import membrane protein